MSIKIITKNKKAFHNYEIGESFEAGIALVGTEVKALRLGKTNLSDGWVHIDDGSAWLKDVHIGPYSHGNIQNHEELRDRRLLLNKHEISKLVSLIEEKGYTVLPIKIFFKNGRIKVEIAVGKGKKLHDKRQTSKDRDANKEMARAVKNINQKNR